MEPIHVDEVRWRRWIAEGEVHILLATDAASQLSFSRLPLLPTAG